MMWLRMESAGHPVVCQKTCIRRLDWPWLLPTMTSSSDQPVWRGRTVALKGNSNTTKSRWRAAGTHTYPHILDPIHKTAYSNISVLGMLCLCPVPQFPMITEFGEETILCCSCEPIIKDTSTIQSQTTNLQQRINSLTQEVKFDMQYSSTYMSGLSQSFYMTPVRCVWSSLLCESC